MMRLGILISGRGSNFEAIANNDRAQEAGRRDRDRHQQPREGAGP